MINSRDLRTPSSIGFSINTFISNAVKICQGRCSQGSNGEGGV